MSWKHIVLEGYCLYNKEEKGLLVPSCCKNEPGVVGIHCLNHEEDSHKYCPFFGYVSARSSIVLTGKNGDEICCKIFSSDEIDEPKWLKEEEEWIKEWEKKLK